MSVSPNLCPARNSNALLLSKVTWSSKPHVVGFFRWLPRLSQHLVTVRKQAIFVIFRDLILEDQRIRQGFIHSDVGRIPRIWRSLLLWLWPNRFYRHGCVEWVININIRLSFKYSLISLVYFARNCDPNPPFDSISLLRNTNWPKWSSDAENPPLLSFFDPAPLVNITVDTYRSEAIQLLIQLRSQPAWEPWHYSKTFCLFILSANSYFCFSLRYCTSVLYQLLENNLSVKESYMSDDSCVIFKGRKVYRKEDY